MKKHLIICLALVALMTSCLKEPTIYLRLPEEDAAAIPYQKGQMLHFVNQDGDTLLYIVTYDETKPFSEDYWDYADDAKTSIIQQPYCYARSVQLHCYTDSIGSRMLFTVIPGKYLYYSWNREMWLTHIDLNESTETITIGDVTYNDVHVSQDYNTQTGELYHSWYYSEEFGLLAVKNKHHSLTLVP